MPTTDTSDSSFDDDIDYDVYSLWSKKELRREGMIDLIRSAGRVSKQAEEMNKYWSTQNSSSRSWLQAYTIVVGRILVQKVGKLNQQVRLLKEEAAGREALARGARGQRVHTTPKNITPSTAAGPARKRARKPSPSARLRIDGMGKKTAHTQSQGGGEEGEAGGEEEPTAAAATLSFEAVCAAVGTEDSHVLDPPRCLRMPAIAAYHDAGGAYPAEERSSRQQPLANGFLITRNPFGRNQPQANKDLKAITLIAQTQLILRGVRDAIVPFKHANKHGQQTESPKASPRAHGEQQADH
jgi:hypothetical protein